MTMPVLVLILIVIFLLGLGCGTTVWFVFRQRQAIRGEEPSKGAAKTLPFRWRYIVLTLSILLLSIILSAYFYHLLPTEVAYHFKPDGSPDRWLSREVAIAWALVPQILLALVAGVVTWGITKLGISFGQSEDIRIKLRGILLLMGNMMALPQIILCFAILDIFSYNSYQIHIMPIWVFALIIMVLGGIILGIFFIRVIRQVWWAG